MLLIQPILPYAFVCLKHTVAFLLMVLWLHVRIGRLLLSGGRWACGIDICFAWKGSMNRATFAELGWSLVCCYSVCMIVQIY